MIWKMRVGECAFDPMDENLISLTQEDHGKGLRRLSIKGPTTERRRSTLAADCYRNSPPVSSNQKVL